MKQDALLIVGCSPSNHANDQNEVAPMLAAISACLGTPFAAALDTGYFNETSLKVFEDAHIEP